MLSASFSRSAGEGAQKGRMRARPSPGLRPPCRAHAGEGHLDQNTSRSPNCISRGERVWLYVANPVVFLLRVGGPVRKSTAETEFTSKFVTFVTLNASAIASSCPHPPAGMALVRRSESWRNGGPSIVLRPTPAGRSEFLP